MMNKEMAVNGMEIDVTTVMDTTTVYEPTYKETIEVENEVEAILNQYFPNFIHEGEGLRSMFCSGGDYWDAKGWLIRAFQKHPGYNGNYQIVLKDQDMCRYVNEEEIKKFFEYVNRWFVNNKRYRIDNNGNRYTVEEAEEKIEELLWAIDDIEKLMRKARKTYSNMLSSNSDEIRQSYYMLKKVYGKIEAKLEAQIDTLEDEHYENQYELDMFGEVDEFIERAGTDCQFCNEELAEKLNVKYNAAQAIKKAYKNGMAFSEIAAVMPHDFYRVLGCDYDRRLYREISDMCSNLHTDEDLKELIKREKQIAAPGQKISKIVTTIAKRCGITNHVDIVDDSFIRNDGVRIERTKDNGWNGQFPNFADSVNPITLKATAVISVHPVDFYTMSFGYKWASCHTIDKENKRKAPGHTYTGCYCGGTMSYMRDGCSIIFYYLPKDFNGNHPELEDKIKRCVFFLGEDKLVQSRVYPDGRDGGEKSLSGDIRTLMQKVVSDIFDVPNYWSLSKGKSACSEVTETKGVQYPDYEEYDDCNVSYLKRIDGYKNKKILPIGRLPICPECGEEHDNHDHIFCCEHKYGLRCSYCGSPISGEPIIVNGEPYCENCVDTCEDCGAICVNAHYVHGGHYICDDCINENYVYSDYDEEYIRSEDAVRMEEGDYFLQDSSGYEECARCHELHNYENVTYDEETDAYYCENCFLELMDERETEDEE